MVQALRRTERYSPPGSAQGAVARPTARVALQGMASFASASRCSWLGSRCVLALSPSALRTLRLLSLVRHRRAGEHRHLHRRLQDAGSVDQAHGRAVPAGAPAVLIESKPRPAPTPASSAALAEAGVRSLGYHFSSTTRMAEGAALATSASDSREDRSPLSLGASAAANPRCCACCWGCCQGWRRSAVERGGGRPAALAPATLCLHAAIAAPLQRHGA